MATNGGNSAPEREIHTYHCLCASLLLASSTPLASLPRRQTSSSRDEAHILPLSSTSARLLSTVVDPKPAIIKSDQGFEKRYFHRCARCSLVVGYQLDWQQFGAERSGRREDVVYLLPGGLMTTDEMERGVKMEERIGFGGVAGVVV